MTKVQAGEVINAIAQRRGKDGLVRVPAVDDMTDETFLRHLELRHPEDLEIRFPPNEDGSPRVLPTRIAFEALHALRHRMGERDFDHDHKEPVRRERAKDF